MGATGVQERAAGGAAAAVATTTTAAREEPRFRSAAELREVLDALLLEVDADPELGSRLRSARVPHRLVCPDLGVSVDVRPADGEGRCVSWAFDDEAGEPAVTLEMDSETANRWLQGRLSLPVGVARRQVSFRATDPRAVLTFLPLSRAICSRYRDLVEERFPHLAVA